MKLITWRVQGTEDRAWLAEDWIHSYSSGRGCMQDTGWVGHGYLSYCGGQQLSQLSQLRKGDEVLWGSENPFLWGAGVLQGMLSASKATITHWEAWCPRASLNCCARRYQFIGLWNPGQTHSFSREKVHYIVILSRHSWSGHLRSPSTRTLGYNCAVAA